MSASENTTAQTSAATAVGALLRAVNAAFADSFTLPENFLIDAYNHIAAAYALSLPTADCKMTATAQDGSIETGLAPAQYRRVFCGDAECLRGTETLCRLLPDFPIYAPLASGSAAVTGSGDYTVCYRALPAAVTAENADTTLPVGGEAAVPYLREKLFAAVYRHIGDRDAADACEAAAARERAAAGACEVRA